MSRNAPPVVIIYTSLHLSALGTYKGKAEAKEGQMDRAWVVVANGSRARFFRAEKSNGELVELAGMEAPEVRAHETKLTTDL
ncbi:MAG: hypothetical protein D6771_00400, partial [Zetaproteobacteria bacterium]